MRAEKGKKGLELGKSLSVINVMEFPFFDRPTGAARLATQLCDKQLEWGYRVFVVCKKLNPDMPDREDRRGMTILRIPETSRRPPDPRNLLDKMGATRRAIKSVISEAGHPDVVHTHTPMQGLAALAAVNPGRTKRIHSIHSPWLLEMRAGGNWEKAERGLPGRVAATAAFFAARRVEAACFKRTDVLTSDSAYTRQEILKDYAKVVRKKRFEVFPGWVDTRRFTPDGGRTDWMSELRRPRRGPVFLTIRGLKPRNGIEILIEAAAHAKREGLQFEVVIGGDGPIRKEIERMIKSLDVTDRVSLLGYIDDEKLPVLYRSCDVFVLPTTALECFGIITLEALASGKPVIATPVGAIPEILKPVYPEGLLPDASAAALAKAMINFAQNHDSARREAQERGRKFRNYVCDNFTLEIGTNRFRDAYESD